MRTFAGITATRDDLAAVHGVVVVDTYVVLVLAFIAAGRRTDARALAGFVSDCVDEGPNGVDMVRQFEFA